MLRLLSDPSLSAHGLAQLHATASGAGRDTDVLSVKHQEQSLPINAGKAQVQRLPWIENGRAVGADNISAPTLFKASVNAI